MKNILSHVSIAFTLSALLLSATPSYAYDSCDEVRDILYNNCQACAPSGGDCVSDESKTIINIYKEFLPYLPDRVKDLCEQQAPSCPSSVDECVAQVEYMNDHNCWS